MRRQGDDIHLGPSEYYWGKAPERIHTVLGSCISITIWNRELRSGGMCHFLMPRQQSEKTGADDARYGQDSVSILAEHLRAEGGIPSRCEVKLLGGAAMFGAGKISIGEMNIRCARDSLAAKGFAIKASHVGGSASRHIIFELETGDVWVRTNSGLLINENKFDPSGKPQDLCMSIAFGGAHG